MNKKYLSIFVLGLLAGALFTTLYMGKELDRLYIELKTLEHDLNRAKERTSRLEKELEEKEEEKTKLEHLVVKDVNIVMEYKEDEFTRLYLQEHSEEITKNLIGQNIENLEPELIFQILNERIVKIEEGQFMLNVNSLIISEVITFYLEAEEIKEEKSDLAS